MKKHISALIEIGKPFSVLLIDLDNFKVYNDTMGHTAGDKVLNIISSRIRDTLSDTEFLARLGGDEFVIVSQANREAILSTASKYMESLSEPITVDGVDLFVGASIGISSYPEASDIDTLLRNADLAMYRAKKLGKGRLHEFEASLDRDISHKLSLGVKLRKALENREFTLHYQPQVSVSTRQIVGVEALLRWNNPELGQVPPSEFIPILEETGLINQAGKWVLATACREMAALHWSGNRIRLSVNLSVRQFQEPDLVHSVLQAIHDSGIDPTKICLESPKVSLLTTSSM